MFEKYTQAARQVIFLARDHAVARKNAAIAPEHLMLGLLLIRTATLPRVSPLWMELLSAVRNVLPGPDAPSKEDIRLTHESKRVLAYAAEESERLNHRYIGDFHLWLGLLRETGAIPAGLLHDYGVFIEDLRSERMDLEHHVRQAALHSSKSLDLSGLSLQSIPRSVLDLSTLTTLLLANNKLENVPDQIDKLESLQYLDLRCNRLAYLPETLRNLPDLTALLREDNPQLGIPMEVLHNVDRSERKALARFGRLTEDEIRDAGIASAQTIIDS